MPDPSEQSPQPLPFPGPWVGGVALILAPLLLLAGVLLRLPFHFFFPQQLAAFQSHPARMAAAYSLFAVGNVLLWPAVATLCIAISSRRPAWAIWGGTLAITGLFARTHSAGIDHLAFQLVRVQNLEAASKAIADSYGAYDIFHALSFAAFFGWMVLAIGAYLAGVLGLIRSVALALMSILMLGTLKGTSLTSVIAAGGLCVAFVPLGFQVLRQGSVPDRRRSLLQALAAIGVIMLFLFLGPRA